MISIFHSLYKDRTAIIGTVSSAASSLVAQVRAPGFLPTNLEGLLAATLTTFTIAYMGLKIYRLAIEKKPVARRRKKR